MLLLVQTRRTVSKIYTHHQETLPTFSIIIFFFNDTPTTEIYTLSLHDALPICSVNRPARLSKAGNAYLRSALYMPAMCAVRHDPRAKAFYDALVSRGKKKMQAQCAVMRKYLTGMWACIKDETAFDSSQLFSEEHMKA